jgi:hypothetical protein
MHPHRLEIGRMPEFRRRKLVTEYEMSTALAYASLPQKKRTSFPQKTSDDLPLNWKSSSPHNEVLRNSHTLSATTDFLATRSWDARIIVVDNGSAD